MVLIKSKESYSIWFKYLTDFPKTYRYSLGSKIDGYFLELLENIFISLYLSGNNKINSITTSISKLDGVKFFLQIAWENKCIPNEKYITISTSLDEIGKMLGGWRKGLLSKTPQR